MSLLCFFVVEKFNAAVRHESFYFPKNNNKSVQDKEKQNHMTDLAEKSFSDNILTEPLKYHSRNNSNCFKKLLIFTNKPINKHQWPRWSCK